MPCSRPTAHRAPLLRPTRPTRTSRAADADAATACVVDSPTGAAAATAAREAAPYVERHSASPSAPASTRPSRAAAPRAESLLHSSLAAAAAAPPAATPAARAASSCADFLAQRSFGPASLPSGTLCAARAATAAGKAEPAEDAEAAEAAEAAAGPVVYRSASVSIAGAQPRPFDSLDAAPPVYRRPPCRALRCTTRPASRPAHCTMHAPQYVAANSCLPPAATSFQVHRRLQRVAAHLCAAAATAIFRRLGRRRPQLRLAAQRRRLRPRVQRGPLARHAGHRLHFADAHHRRVAPGHAHQRGCAAARAVPPRAGRSTGEPILQRGGLRPAGLGPCAIYVKTCRASGMVFSDAVCEAGDPICARACMLRCSLCCLINTI